MKRSVVGKDFVSNIYGINFGCRIMWQNTACWIYEHLEFSITLGGIPSFNKWALGFEFGAHSFIYLWVFIPHRWGKTWKHFIKRNVFKICRCVVHKTYASPSLVGWCCDVCWHGLCYGMKGLEPNIFISAVLRFFGKSSAVLRQLDRYRLRFFGSY